MIDDDQDDREIFLEAILKCDSSLEVFFAKDGVEALELLETASAQPDVIFLDYNMPRMNGVECLKRLKAGKITKDIPVVMYTTSGNREEENFILKLGADYYMRKTASFTQLCDELQRLLQLVEKEVPKIARN